MEKITITTALLVDLRQKAEAASPSWCKQRLASLLRFAQKNDGPWNDDENDETYKDLPCESDADYIVAANRAVVLALVDEIERLERQLLIREEVMKAISDNYPAVIAQKNAEIERLNQRYDEQKLLATKMIEHAAGQKKEIDQLKSERGWQT